MPPGRAHVHVAAGPADFQPRRIPLRDSDYPKPGEIHAWFLDLNEMAGSLRAALDDPGSEPGAAAFTPGQVTFTRRFYLRLLLGAYLGLPGKAIRIIRTRKGKPILDPDVHGGDLHFSIAKSGPGFLVGVSSTSYLGVDIEPVDRVAHNALGVARRYFSAAEASALAALTPEQLVPAFLRTWSCKEAVVKSLGLGIANQLCRFTVDIDPANPAAILQFDGEDPAAWWLQMVRPAENFIGAIATRSSPVTLRSFRMRPAEGAESR